MANEFSEKILTADGKNFIAQAASGNKKACIDYLLFQQ